ncbi:PAS domain S-box protein [Hugenholtzia roseola]|uniref:PAS domain S-box protein n=1 Tax=Hugenholtzia roseola TaxID=1002 RepID=UPI000550BB60|nr:PAS domain S-box protein [Hugenholtzia roseola]
MKMNNREVLEQGNIWQAIFEQAPIGLAKIDLSGRFLAVNEAMATTFGYQAAELLERNFLDLMSPQELECELKAHIAQGGGFRKKYRQELLCLHKTGRNFYCLVQISLIKDDKKGEPLFLLGQVIDMSKQKDFELLLKQQNEALKKSNQQLVAQHIRAQQEHRNCERIKQLIQAIDTQEPNVRVLQEQILLLKKEIALQRHQEQQESFDQYFQQLNPDFFKRLKADFPALSSADLRMCAFLRLNFSTKEIAQMLSVSNESAHKARYRLRKKMCLQREQDLIEIVMKY